MIWVLLVAESSATNNGLSLIHPSLFIYHCLCRLYCTVLNDTFLKTVVTEDVYMDQINITHTLWKCTHRSSFLQKWPFRAMSKYRFPCPWSYWITSITWCKRIMCAHRVCCVACYVRNAKTSETHWHVNMIVWDIWSVVCLQVSACTWHTVPSTSSHIQIR